MEFPTTYDPKQVEERIYQTWLKKSCFKASNSSPKKPFTIVIPPPNVTGVLHMGHALVNTLQDILIRWKRMCGFEALWVPGTDHAGISTQTVVERHLQKTYGKKRADFSKEEFLQEVWKWKSFSEETILKQIEKLGSSCDWSRLAFTMDEERSKAVSYAFSRLFQDGLIYQGLYLVNWDPIAQTAIADDEVEYEEREGFLYFIRYPVSDTKEFITIATTRPETMLGDVAVAISPKDDRYAHLIGKMIDLPLTHRKIPIVADPHIDPAFGTGAMKVTPAHDVHDHEIGKRHNLPQINMMTPDGKVNEVGGSFQGLFMKEARVAILEELKKLGLLVKQEPHLHRVGISYRSKAVIEPFLSKQWFFKLSHFKEPLLEAIRSKAVRLLPEQFEATYNHWIHNLRDWCISRQLWWGHQIPVWYHQETSEVVCISEQGEIPEEVLKNPSLWRREEDVLDTWFSSALWPLSVLGWPNPEAADFKTFYPTSTLVTGHDILFFWVTRMMVMGKYFTGKYPFRDVFLHGLIYGKSYWKESFDGSIAYLSKEEREPYELGKNPPPDVYSKWEKMSKSKGNTLDPMEMINSFGADAVRMALAMGATGSRQIDLDRRRFEEFKNFTNKLWNGARFVFMNLEGLSLQEDLEAEYLKLEDRWILSVLGRTITEINAALGSYQFDKAAEMAYDFFWNQFCASYVEIAKPTLFGKVHSDNPKYKETKQKILLITLTSALRLLHPMAPFVTEELFGIIQASLQEKLKNGPLKTTSFGYLQEALEALNSTSCMQAPYPKLLHPKDVDLSLEKEFEELQTVVRSIRNLRSEMEIPLGVKNDLFILASPEKKVFLEKNFSILEAQLKLGKTLFLDAIPDSLEASSAHIHSDVTNCSYTLLIPIPQELREKEFHRLKALQEKNILAQNSAKEKLSNPDFLAKAPPQLVEKTKKLIADTEEELLQVAKKLQAFSKK